MVIRGGVKADKETPEGKWPNAVCIGYKETRPCMSWKWAL